MKKETVLREIQFELDCSKREATSIYREYEKSNNLEELLYRLKYHKEIKHGVRPIQRKSL